MTINPLERAAALIHDALKAFKPVIITHDYDEPVTKPLPQCSDESAANGNDGNYIELDELLADGDQCACGAGYKSAAECPWCSGDSVAREAAIDAINDLLANVPHGPPPRTEPDLSDDELVMVRQLIEERFGDQTSSAPGAAVAGGAPGEVRGDTPDAPPSPGDHTDSDLLAAAANQLASWNVSLNGIVGEHSHAKYLSELITELRDRAAQFAALESVDEQPVREDDLAAHITASRRASEEDEWGGTAIDDHIASELLADFHITRKK